MMNKLKCVVAVLLVAVPVGVKAFDLPNSRGEGFGRTMLIGNAAASTLTMLPTAGIEPRSWRAELGGLRYFELSELDDVFAAGAYRFGSIGIAAGVSHFGDPDIYGETTARLAAGCHYGNLGFGSSLSGRLVAFGGGYQGLSAATVGVSVTYHWDRFHFGVAADNLTRPRFNDGAVPFGRGLDVLVELIGEGSYQMTGRAEFEEGEAPRFGLGQRFDLISRAALFWGVASEPLTWGGGIDIMHDGARITYAASYHPVLGLTHALSVAYESGKTK